MPLLLIGVGNTFREDDGAGLAVAEAVRAASVPGVEVRVAPGEAAGLIEAWRDAQRVVVVDAMRAGVPAGTVREFRVGHAHDDQALAGTDLRAFSSHGLGVAAAVALARQIDALPPSLTVIGIEGARFGTGTSLSPEVAGAVERVAVRIRELATAPDAGVRLQS
jgi:hydrogenase maturation protease